MRSSSSRSASYFSASATSVSSRNRRRSPGPSFTSARSSGENTRDPHHAEQLARPAQLLPVDQHPVAPVPAELELDQHLAAVVVQRPSRGRRRCSAPTRISASSGRAAEAVERGQVGQRLGEVGLALPVEPDDGGGARMEVERRVRVVAEVDELEPGDDHACATCVTAPGRASAGTGSRRCRRRGRPPASTRRAWTA